MMVVSLDSDTDIMSIPAVPEEFIERARIIEYHLSQLNCLVSSYSLEMTDVFDKKRYLWLKGEIERSLQNSQMPRNISDYYKTRLNLIVAKAGE